MRGNHTLRSETRTCSGRGVEWPCTCDSLPRKKRLCHKEPEITSHCLKWFSFFKVLGKKKKKIPQIHLLGRNNGAEVVLSIDVKTIIQNMAPFLFCAGSRGALGQHLWTDQMDGRLCHEQLKKFLTQLNKFLVSLPASMEFLQPEFQAPSI